jgi:serine protease Do
MTEDNQSGNDTPLDVASRPEHPRHHRMIGSWIIGVAVAAGLCFVAGYAGVVLGMDGQSLSGLQQSSSDGNKVITASEKDISTVVDKVSPSVVSILSTGTSERGGFSFQGAGTGMIVSKDGYILTNKHVVNDVSSVTVITSEGKSYEDVSVVGVDPLNDVAFLKIKGETDLPALAIGDSKTVRVGQSVIAIGNALGQYQNTVTTGIISGLGRPVTASSDGTSANAESLSDLLQTDAAINSGNSGGPLLNMQGQVIGMNTAVAEDAQSIGFAIPIGATKGMLEHLIDTGDIERAIVGVQYVSITPEVKAEYKLEADQGDYIIAEAGNPIRKNSPADRAGIRNKDIIIKVNNEVVGAGKSTSTLIGEFKPGDTVTLTIVRDGKTLDKEVTLAAL